MILFALDTLIPLKRLLRLSASTLPDPSSQRYIRQFSSRIYIYIFLRKSATPFPPSSNSPPFSRISPVNTHTKPWNERSTYSQDSHSAVLSIAGTQLPIKRAGRERATLPWKSISAFRSTTPPIPPRLAQANRKRNRERERETKTIFTSWPHCAWLATENREPRARNSLETIRKPIPGWRASDRATIRSNGWRLECIRGAGLKPSHEGLPRVMRVGPESRISARRQTDARNGLPDRLTHPWPGLRQTGITRPAGVLETSLQTSPDFSWRFSSLSVAFRGKPGEDDLGRLHPHHTNPETLGFRASLSRCCTRSIEAVSSSVAWDFVQVRRELCWKGIETDAKKMCKCRFEFSEMEVAWKLLMHEQEIWQDRSTRLSMNFSVVWEEGELFV